MSRLPHALSAVFLAASSLLACSSHGTGNMAGSAPGSNAGDTANGGGNVSNGGSGGSGANNAGSTNTGGASGGSVGQTSGQPQLSLPIEVLGSGAPDEPVIAGTGLTLAAADLSAVQTLYVSCHRCGFYDPPEFEALAKPLVKAKASLRVVGGPDAANANSAWLDITNSTVQIDPWALAHGGINGGLVTLSFQVPLDAAARARLVAGNNRIEFRFNGTDGSSNGFRVLDVQFRDAQGKNLSPADQVWADIALEKAAGQAPSDASTRGQALWAGRNLLVKSPIVPRKIRAACNDCHAADGRDLQYFNYSNNSIVQRSRFHGLTEAQGQDIAAYLRASLYASKVPHVAAAAPWNPPFQPGPGLDSKPAVEWTAGAGLSAVLPDGKAFIQAFVGQAPDASPLAVKQADVDAVMDASKVLNTREMPLPLQFPDWNAWLPIVHPLDIWTPDAGQTTGLFETGYLTHNPLADYAALVTWLTTNKNPNGVYGDWSHLTPSQRNDLQGKLLAFGSHVIDFGGGSRGTRVSPDPKTPFGIQMALPKLQALLSPQTEALADLTTCGPTGQCDPFSADSFLEREDLGLYHWMIIKQWELVETYGLQDQRSFHGSVDANKNWAGEGEARGWPYSWPSVFYVAPHMLYAPTSTPQGLREFYFSWENRLISYYRTNAWYQLQVTINPGWAGASNGAIDWPYTQGFITGLSDELNTAKAPGWIAATHLARYFQVNTKLFQLANTNLPFDSPNPQDPTNLFANGGIQSKADLIFKLSPAVVMDSYPDNPSHFHALDQISPGAYLLFVNGSIAVYNTMFTSTTHDQYRICDPTNMTMGTAEQFAGQRFCVDAARSPLPLDAQGRQYCPYPANDGYTTAQYSVWGILQAKKIGADATLVQAWSDWVDRMWP